MVIPIDQLHALLLGVQGSNAPTLQALPVASNVFLRVLSVPKAKAFWEFVELGLEDCAVESFSLEGDDNGEGDKVDELQNKQEGIILNEDELVGLCVRSQFVEDQLQ